MAEQSAGLARFRLVLWSLVVVAAIGATVLFFTRPPAAPVGVTGTPFSLQSSAGGTFTEQDLKGTPSLVFFGYTFCPDVCPTTMAESTQWKQALGLTDKDIRTIFITVDPARDTMEVLKAYLSAFDPGIIGLVGTPDETELAKASFGAFSENAKPDSTGAYLVNHTANVFLMDAEGRFASTIAYGESTDSALAKIKRLVKG